MDFLVIVRNQYPPDADQAERETLERAESDRAAHLAADGVLVHLWRRPGQRSSVGLWRAEDATLLHASLASLPFYQWLDIEVWPLAKHPNDPATFREQDG